MECHVKWFLAGGIITKQMCRNTHFIFFPFFCFLIWGFKEQKWKKRERWEFSSKGKTRPSSLLKHIILPCPDVLVWGGQRLSTYA